MTKLVHDDLKEKPNLLLCTVRGCCFPVRDLLFAWFASTCSPIKKVYAKDDTVYLSDHCYGIGFFRMTMQIDVLDISFHHHHHKSTKNRGILLRRMVFIPPLDFCVYKCWRCKMHLISIQDILRRGKNICRAQILSNPKVLRLGFKFFLIERHYWSKHVVQFSQQPMRGQHVSFNNLHWELYA